ncbi:two-component system histidine kinase PnpS [Bacillus sp. NPDC077027]|uniref:two-component system histidine kinase PnpS n=1 Tax=Bacillus sp. NPDC077027 TaxID=3390548 RepID=UPI003CFEB13A
MSKIRTRLFSGLIFLLFIVFLGLGLFLDHMFHVFYETKLTERMEKESSYLLSMMNGDALSSKQNEQILNKAKQHLNMNATIVDQNGKIVHASGQKEQEAIIGKALQNSSLEAKGGVIEDGSDTLFHYVVPIDGGNGKAGYLFLNASFHPFDEIDDQLWMALALCLGTAIIIIVFFGYRMSMKYVKPIDYATKVAKRLERGNYDTNNYAEFMIETSELNTSMKRLAESLQEMTSSGEMQRDRLQTVIENIGAGIILIDKMGYINLINRTFRKQFKVQKHIYMHKLYHDAFTHEEIVELIDEIFMSETKVRKFFRLAIDIERRYFQVDGVPILSTDDEWKGIVLVFHDVTETKQLEQMRKDFVANVSHELKTPITSIKGFTETLLDGAVDDKEALTNFLSIILKESVRLETLIQDLLDLSKIEQQHFKLNIQETNATEIIQEIEALLRQKAAEKGILLKINVPTESTHVMADPLRLKQIFLNLVNNALAYTPEGGTITISARPRKEYHEFDVADTGVGMKKSEIPRIFERFYRIDKDRSRNSGGTGLGLAIVKHLVEAHEGSISVSSKQGKGTTFTVSLKAKKK